MGRVSIETRSATAGEHGGGSWAIECSVAVEPRCPVAVVPRFSVAVVPQRSAAVAPLRFASGTSVGRTAADPGGGTLKV